MKRLYLNKQICFEFVINNNSLSFKYGELQS